MANIILLVLIKLLYDFKIWPFMLITFLGLVGAVILDILNYIIYRKENVKVQRKFTKRIDGLLASILRGIIEIGTLPYKAWISLKAIVKTFYRMQVTKEHLLEWTTADEAEKKSKTDLASMYKNMMPNIVIGVIGIILSIIIWADRDVHPYMGYLGGQGILPLPWLSGRTGTSALTGSFIFCFFDFNPITHVVCKQAKCYQKIKG